MSESDKSPEEKQSGEGDIKDCLEGLGLSLFQKGVPGRPVWAGIRGACKFQSEALQAGGPRQSPGPNCFTHRLSAMNTVQKDLEPCLSS